MVKEVSRIPSSWRQTSSLDDYLKKQGVVGFCDIDTRALVRHLRDKGSMRAVIVDAQEATEENLARWVTKAQAVRDMQGADLAQEVSITKTYTWDLGSPLLNSPQIALRYHVVVMDFGTKYNILRRLVDVGCRVTVVPAKTSAQEVLAHKPDGVVLSNGPGDPESVTYGIATTRALLGKLPVFGICLGHQLLCLAMGGKSYKLKFGHRGANHPVMDVATNKVEITSQNHGFCIDPASLPQNKVKITHINLNDKTLAGIALTDTPAFSVQYHPEAAPGPNDSAYLFKRFTRMMDAFKKRVGNMPKRTDIKRILVVGSGPIVIGQACEFDYSGTQAIKALRADGYEVVLVNSNPATIMTDPNLSDRTYIEPLTPEYLEQIIARERPDAILPTVGGQTALNLTLKVAELGILARYDVEVIGASLKAIEVAEDRALFRDAMQEIGLDVPRSVAAHTLQEAREVCAHHRISGGGAPLVYLGGLRRRHRLQCPGVCQYRQPRPGVVAGDPGFGGRVPHRLERIRAGGDARPQRQRGDRVLYREPRSDGRAYGGLYHGGPGANPDGPRVPAHARCGHRHLASCGC